MGFVAVMLPPTAAGLILAQVDLRWPPAPCTTRTLYYSMMDRRRPRELMGVHERP